MQGGLASHLPIVQFSGCRQISPWQQGFNIVVFGSSHLQLVFLAVRVHPFPFRTRKLSSPVPTILAWRRAGKIGQRQHKDYGEMIKIHLSVFLLSQKNGALLCHPVDFSLISQSAEFFGNTLRIFYDGSWRFSYFDSIVLLLIICTCVLFCAVYNPFPRRNHPWKKTIYKQR